MDGSKPNKSISSSTKRDRQSAGSIARLVAERGATKPRVNILELAR